WRGGQQRFQCGRLGEIADIENTALLEVAASDHVEMDAMVIWCGAGAQARFVDASMCRIDRAAAGQDCGVIAEISQIWHALMRDKIGAKTVKDYDDETIGRHWH